MYSDLCFTRSISGMTIKPVVPGSKHSYRPWRTGTPPAEMINFVACKFVWHGGSPLRHVNTLE